MRNQLNNTTSRLRRDGLYNIIHGLKIDPPERSDDDEDEAPFEDRVPIKVTVSMLATPELRSQYFKVLIGWRADTSEYSIYGVPLLHGNESDTLDFNELFRHRLLLKVCCLSAVTAVTYVLNQVFASIIRGTRGPVGLMKKKSKLPRAECMQRTFSIGFTTPGAITSCAILVRDLHLLSCGTDLRHCVGSLAILRRPQPYEDRRGNGNQLLRTPQAIPPEDPRWSPSPTPLGARLVPLLGLAFVPGAEGVPLWRGRE
jgi:hypothetical protein